VAVLATVLAVATRVRYYDNASDICFEPTITVGAGVGTGVGFGVGGTGVGFGVGFGV
jgi:hypothetical protein